MIRIEPLASGSKGNAFMIDDGATKLLLDCGISWKEIQKKCDYIIPEACLITHAHADHSKAYKDVLKYGLNVYITHGTIEAINANVSAGVNIITAHKEFNVGSWNVIPFDIKHDAIEPVGFICITNTTGEVLVYLTDTMYCKYTFPNVTHWLVECNYIKEIIDENVELSAFNITLRNRIIKNHMSLETLKDMLKANDLTQTKEIWLMHLSDRNSDADRMKREIQKISGKVVYVA